MKTCLQNAIAPYEYYFSRSGWTKQVSTGSCVDEVRFQKADGFIRISEDLREHFVNMEVSAGVRRATVEFRTCRVYDSTLDVKDLCRDVARLGSYRNNLEEAEVLIYVRFLKRKAYNEHNEP